MKTKQLIFLCFSALWWTVRTRTTWPWARISPFRRLGAVRTDTNSSWSSESRRPPPTTIREAPSRPRTATSVTFCTGSTFVTVVSSKVNSNVLKVNCLFRAFMSTFPKWCCYAMPCTLLLFSKHSINFWPNTQFHFTCGNLLIAWSMKNQKVWHTVQSKC